MPLIHSSSNEARESNISELKRSGYPLDQAVAIGYSTQRRAAGKKDKKRKKSKKSHSSSSSMRTIEPNKAGQKPLKFHEGGLHSSTGTPAGEKISPAKHAAAASGKLGPKAKKQEMFYRNVLKK